MNADERRCSGALVYSAVVRLICSRYARYITAVRRNEESRRMGMIEDAVMDADMGCAMRERRFVLVSMSDAVLAGLLTSGNLYRFKCREPFPLDAMLCGVSCDSRSGEILLRFAHPDFPHVPEGAHIIVYRFDVMEIGGE